MANITLGTLRDYWKGVYDAVKTGGAAKGTTGMQVAGTDGTNTQIIKTNASGDVLTQLTGSNMELYGAVIGDRPAATAVDAGTTFTIVDANLDQNWVSDGTNWLEV